MTKLYGVEALDEPRGEGNGWEQVDDDAQATCFGVYDVNEFDGWEDYADTREAAQAIADRMTQDTTP
jgi:hypothetical protein